MTNKEAIAKFVGFKVEQGASHSSNSMSRLEMVDGGKVNSGSKRIWFCNRCGEEVIAGTRKSAIKIHSEVRK